MGELVVLNFLFLPGGGTGTTTTHDSCVKLVYVWGKESRGIKVM
jgi:hypothetical protein